MSLEMLVTLANDIDTLKDLNDQIEAALEVGDTIKAARLGAKATRLLAVVAPYGSGE